MAAVPPQRIIENLYRLLTSEAQTNRFYFNRSVGYQHEFEFSQLCDRLNIQTLDGGMFLMRNNPDYHGVYVTISGGNKDDYLPLYSQLRSIRRESVSQMFFGEIRGWNNNPATIRIKEGPELNLDIGEPIIVVLQHSETTAPDQSHVQMVETLEAVRATGLQTVVVYPCSDQGYEGIVRAIDELAHSPQFRAQVNLEAPLFRGLLNVASVMMLPLRSLATGKSSKDSPVSRFESCPASEI